ncbi:MAG: phosphatase PAP2-related protein [Candidatus Nomurabacteria bacterium]|nr:phosphatase PAP2-related protein [Candidatus Nomurabacteria bacterium]
MNQKISEYKNLFEHRQFLTSLGLSVVFLAISMIINFQAGTYATESASNSVTDIILSNIRVYDVDNYFVYGSFLFVLAIILVCLYKPERLPFTVKSIALFIVIRSIFITLTHLGPFPSQLIINSNLMSKISFGGDLFFSGHTGMPFLLSLIFWKDKWTRYLFLSFSFMFAVVVLLAHLHYSIDVLSAYFITYTIFHIALYLFKKERDMFHYFENI